MAIEPVFNTTVDSIRQRLKLSGATQSDTITAIEQAVREVRVGLYEELGSARVDEILTFSSTDNPTTNEELVRARAEQTEVAWVKLILVRELPVIFMDSSGNTSQIWNEESLTRDASSADLNELAKVLESRVHKGLEDLVGSFEPGQGAVDLIGPSSTPPRPGSTVFPPWSGGSNL